MDILVISASEVLQLVTMKEVIEVVEDVMRLKGEGKVVMPEKVYVDLPKGDFRVMPCFVDAYGMAGTKIVSVCPENNRLNLPTVQAVMFLMDAHTGSPLAIIDGTVITSLRTGAAGGVAVKYLANIDGPVRVGIVGAGVQARTQLAAIKEVISSIEEVRVADLNVEKAKKFAEEMGYLGVKFAVSDSVEKAVREANLIVTTTPSRAPIVMDEWVSPGAHINAIGADAPGKQELDPRILRRARIFVDDLKQAAHSGEINVPLKNGLISLEDVAGELSDVIVGKIVGRSSPDEVTIFDSTGLGIWDLATAKLVYHKARREGVGKVVEL